jgi:hypothetical protein
MKIFLMLVATAAFCVGARTFQPESEGIMKGFNPFGKETSDRKIVNAIHRYSNHLYEEKGIELKMYGLELNKIHEPADNTIDTIHSTYSINRHMGYREARALLYEIADGFIAHMNEQKDLLQYFYKSPIGYEHLDLCIAFDYELKGNLKVGEMDDVRISENKAIYFIVNKELPPKMQFTSTTDPEIFTLGNFCSNTRRVVRPLPETEQDIATEP